MSAGLKKRGQKKRPQKMEGGGLALGTADEVGGIITERKHIREHQLEREKGCEKSYGKVLGGGDGREEVMRGEKREGK